MAPTWSIDQTRILSQTEIAAVLDDLARKAPRSVNTRQNLVIFRLATCCGLRVSELIGLTLRDIRVGIPRPYINVRKAVAKLGRPRRIPLWWDAGTLRDLESWKREREDQGAGRQDYLVCSQARRSFGKQLDRRNARHRFKVACDVLGPERRDEITIHHGRHSFVSHALAGDRSLAEVRDAAGHANVSTTSIYTHVAVDDDGRPGDLFAFRRGCGESTGC